MKKACVFLTLFCIPVIALAQLSSSSVIDGPTHDGASINCDLPGSQHIKNIGSKVNGAGMCVTSSIEMAARYQNLEPMRGFRDWCAQFPGGGYPQKVDSLLAKYFTQKQLAPYTYFQYEGHDPEVLLDLIDKTNRMACITYGQSPRYGQRSIAHMVCAVLYRNNYGVVLDNNFPGEKNYEWMSRQELVRRMKYPSGNAWVFVWCTPGSPPPPKARKAR